MTDGTEDGGSTANTIITTGLGLIGGAMSVLFGPKTLTSKEKVGCVVAGGTCAFVFAPLVPMIWPAANYRVISLAGFIFGIGGLFIVRGLLSWLTRAERNLPDQLDKRLGVDTSDKNKSGVTPPPAPADPKGDA